MATGNSGITFQVIGGSCTASGASATITPPSNGFVVVSGETRMRINHAVGAEDRWLITIGDTAANCPQADYSWLDSVAAGVPTQAQVWVSAFSQNVFPVTGGVTYSFYLNGYMVTGADANDVFIYANVIAVFYPS